MKSQETDNVDAVVLQVPSAPKPLSKSSRATAPRTVAKKPEPKAVEAANVAVKAANVEKVPKANKKLKLKVVRDSFTMPASEYQKIAEIKNLCLKSGLQIKKSEVLRAGLITLCAMDEEPLKSALSSLEKIKTGRPNKR